MKKILLLFEDYNQLSTTEVYLKKVGFDVVGIGNEAKLSDQLLAFNPDVVVSGGLTQLVSTLSVGARLKENTRFLGKSVIILPQGYRLLPQDLIKIKMDATLEAPVEPLRLLQVLAKVCGLDAELISEKFRKATLADPDLQKKLKEAIGGVSKKQSSAESSNSAAKTPSVEVPKKKAFLDPARAARYEKFLKTTQATLPPSDLSQTTFGRKEVRERQEELKKGWDLKELEELDILKQQFAKALFKKE